MIVSDGVGHEWVISQKLNGVVVDDLRGHTS